MTSLERSFLFILQTGFNNKETKHRMPEHVLSQFVQLRTHRRSTTAVRLREEGMPAVKHGSDELIIRRRCGLQWPANLPGLPRRPEGRIVIGGNGGRRGRGSLPASNRHDQIAVVSTLSWVSVWDENARFGPVDTWNPKTSRWEPGDLVITWHS